VRRVLPGVALGLALGFALTACARTRTNAPSDHDGRAAVARDLDGNESRAELRFRIR